MEVFSQLLNSQFATNQIGYHPKTRNLDLSHLMFADDVMIFFDGRSNSLHGIMDTMEVFASWSGLSLNKDKSELYTAGLSVSQVDSIGRYGFKSAHLPVRYLGLPLMHRKLRVSEYDALFSSINKSVNGWATKSLSFAGRLQLLKTVVAGKVNFWMSTFILPVTCIKRLQRICSRFLWGGTAEIRKTPRVSWKQICFPKEEGGLGLRNFQVWKRALCLRHVWSLFSGKETLWTAWHREKSLRSESFWEVRSSTMNSYNWNSILSLRPLASKFIKGVLGNGTTLSFWHDSWTDIGPLITFLGVIGPSQIQIPLQAKVADAVTGNCWRIQTARSDKILEVLAHLTELSTPQENSGTDSYCWMIDGRNCNGYSSSLTWDYIRPKDSEKTWAKSVWFKGNVPKHAFHMWLTHLDRLPTRQRLLAWGLISEPTCCLCGRHIETRDHIMLHCEFSIALWGLSLTRMERTHQRFENWSSLLSWMERSSSSAPQLLRRIVAQSSLYHIWRQRNNLLHNNISITPECIFRCIYKEVKTIIISRGFRRKFRNLMSLWLM